MFIGDQNRRPRDRAEGSGGFMSETGLQRNQHTRKEIKPGYTYDACYKVENEDGCDVGVDILYQYYGEVWRQALDRVNTKIDGHMFTICHNGCRFDVYRKVHGNRKRIFPPLRLVKSL
jgi:hypothetical protein